MISINRMAMAGLVVLAACSETIVQPTPVCEMSVTASPSAVTLEQGTSQTLSATGSKSSDCNGVHRTWRSDNPTVAAVTREGRVTGIRSGVATIRVIDRDVAGVEAASPVTVTVVTPVTVSVSAQSSTFEVGATQQLTATVGGTNNQSVSWASSATQVVTVSPQGVATAVSPGVATLTATSAASPGKSASVTLTVLPAVTISVSAQSTTFEVGATQQLTATVGGTTNQSVSWASSATQVVTVSPQGVATAVSPGVATLTATSAASPGKSASVTLTVLPAVTISVSAQSSTFEVGATQQLTATVGGTTNQSVSWTSSATQVVTVSAQGVATALSPGVATLTATSAASPDKSASVTLTVVSAAAEVIHRWSFSETGGAGTVLADAVGGANGRIVDVGPNNATVGSGQVTLTGGDKGSSDYVELPPGLISGLSDATIELWTTMHSIKVWSRLFDFGSGMDNFLMMNFTWFGEAAKDRVEWRGGFGVVDSTMAPYPIDTQVHVTMTIDEGGGTDGATLVRWYFDGALRGSAETTATLSSLADVNNWLGRSQFGDMTANASWNEFRIWKGALSAAEVQASFARGPDGLP